MTAIAARLGAERREDRELGVALVGLREEIAGASKPALVMPDPPGKKIAVTARQTTAGTPPRSALPTAFPARSSPIASGSRNR
jgi:hypothetical protein